MKFILLAVALLLSAPLRAEIFIHDLAHNSKSFSQYQGSIIELPGHGDTPVIGAKRFGLLSLEDYAAYIADQLNNLIINNGSRIIASGAGATALLIALSKGWINPQPMTLYNPFPPRQIAWAYSDNGGAEVEFLQWVESTNEDFYYFSIPDEKFSYLFNGDIANTYVLNSKNNEPFVAASQALGMYGFRRPSLPRNLLAGIDAEIVYFKQSYFYDSPTANPLVEMAAYLNSSFRIVDNGESYHDCFIYNEECM